jgi:hypothetical protein
MVGTRLGDSGGDGTLKSRAQTTPNGQKFGSGAGHPPFWVVVGAVVDAVVDAVVEADVGAELDADEDAMLDAVVGTWALDQGVVIPTAKEMAHNSVTPTTASGFG